MKKPDLRLDTEKSADPMDADCPNCGHHLTEPINDIWKDPNVQLALKDGRAPNDVAVLFCPKCGKCGYYNQGSHFYCRFCKQEYYCISEGEEPPTGFPWLRLDDHTTLDDTVTECTEGYNNHTLP